MKTPTDNIKEEQMTDQQLVRALKKGSEQAFNVIFNRMFSSLFQYSVQFIKSQSEAEDIVQEAFIRLWQHREKITSDSSVKSLLYVTTRNLLLTRLKQNLNSPVYEDYLNYVNHFGDHDNCPIEYEEFKAHVESVIDELPPHQSRVVRMSKLNQMTNKEIASLLGINEQSVKNNLSLGMKYLRGRFSIPLILLLNTLLLK